MRILALDLGDSCGWARFSNGKIESGTLNLKLLEGEHPGERWPRVRDSFRALASRCDWIVWETVVNLAGPFARASLFGLEAQLVEVAAVHTKSETKTVMPASLKKWATGDGRAKKDDMRRAAAERFPGEVFATHDQIDARWVLEWAIQTLVPTGRVA